MLKRKGVAISILGDNVTCWYKFRCWPNLHCLGISGSRDITWYLLFKLISIVDPKLWNCQLIQSIVRNGKPEPFDTPQPKPLIYYTNTMQPPQRPLDYAVQLQYSLSNANKMPCSLTPALPAHIHRLPSVKDNLVSLYQLFMQPSIWTSPPFIQD